MVKGVREKVLLGAGDGTYFTDLRHLCVSGTNKSIGRKLAEYAKLVYGVGGLGRYDDPEYGRMRQHYFRRNWPEMADRMRGVEEAFRALLTADSDGDYDYSALIYDVPPVGTPRRSGSSAVDPGGSGIMPGCSAVYIPAQCTTGGRPLVARNYDAWRMKASVAFTCAPDDPGAQGQLYGRPFVLELRPRRRRKIIALGGHDLLCPFQDAMNDSGLYITSLADDAVPLDREMTMAGGRNVGLGSRQLLLLLSESCASVKEVKEAVRGLVVRKDIGLHWLIADAHGSAAILRIDPHQCVIFCDAPSDVPFLVTNHPIDRSGQCEALAAAHRIRRSHCQFVKPDPDKPCTYPDCFGGNPTGPCAVFGGDFAYDTFIRMKRLEDGVAEQKTKYSFEHATALMDMVTCAFRSNDKAGIRRERNTRTVWSVTTELTPANQHLSVRFYLGDGDPVSAGANKLKIAWAAYEFGFGFRRKMLSKEKPKTDKAA